MEGIIKQSFSHVEEKDLKVQLPSLSEEDLKSLQDVTFMNCIILVLLGNYSQTGHFGGPLAYTPASVAAHLAGAELGGLRYDIRSPKHPFTDKFMLTGGHCIPTCYALWIILYEAMAKQHAATKDPKYQCDPKHAFLAVDALGFRRSPDACLELLKKNNLEEDPLFAQAKIRGIRALMGHAESTDCTNDVNGGPSGIGAANTAGKALFWDFVGAPTHHSVKVLAFEGEFAFTEGHAQELKTIALSQQVGKRLRLLFSYNNAGIDDALIGDNAVIKSKYTDYNIANQFTSYGWNVFVVPDGADFKQIIAVYKTMEDWPEDDRRPMVVIANTVKGYWPTGVRDLQSHKMMIIQSNNPTAMIESFESHPYGFPMNGDYFILLCSSFEEKFGIRFEGIRDGAPKGEIDRLKQFKTNIDIALSVLDLNDGALRTWVSNRLIKIAAEMPVVAMGGSEEEVKRIYSNLRLDPKSANPFKDQRLKLANIPIEKQEVTVVGEMGKQIKVSISLFEKAGQKKGTRRVISEIGKWINYVTGNRLLTIAADLSNSINVENCNITGHYDPVTNPIGTRLKAGIQECANAATMTGLVSCSLSENPKEHNGLWGISGTYGAFTPLMYLPLRIFSQQNQDSPFELGVVTIVAGHSGPETAADARSHFGIFAPQVWTLFPEGQIINLYFWDYNDVAPGYFAALEHAATVKEAGVIVIHVARPDVEVADRTKFADTDIKAAAKGCYLIREFEKGKPKQGTVLVQGASSTTNLVKLIPRLENSGINVRIVSVISQDLFRLQPQDYQDHIMPLSQRLDCMVVSTMTKRILPLSGLGPLTKQYSVTSDWDDRWRTGGLESDVIKEAHMDEESIFIGVSKFALSHPQRIEQQTNALKEL